MGMVSADNDSCLLRIEMSQFRSSDILFHVGVASGEQLGETLMLRERHWSLRGRFEMMIALARAERSQQFVARISGRGRGSRRRRRRAFRAIKRINGRERRRRRRRAFRGIEKEANCGVSAQILDGSFKLRLAANDASVAIFVVVIKRSFFRSRRVEFFERNFAGNEANKGRGVDAQLDAAVGGKVGRHPHLE